MPKTQQQERADLPKIKPKVPKGIMAIIFSVQLHFNFNTHIYILFNLIFW